jgi:azurin
LNQFDWSTNIAPCSGKYLNQSTTNFIVDTSVDSSPIKRFFAFWMGLATFCAFGVLSYCAYKVTGGDDDPEYEAASKQRSQYRVEAEKAQDDKLNAAPVDLTAAAGALGKQRDSGKPAPGTKAFEEWMKKQAAATPAAPPEEKDPKEPAENPPIKEKPVIKVAIDALPGGVMKFKQAELSLKAGSSVELTFSNPDVLQHNFLLLKPGTKEKVGALADAMLTDPEAMKKHYVPESTDILAKTKLVNPFGKEVIKFTVPDEPGDYPYICTFPGHWRLMFGTLKVTK